MAKRYKVGISVRNLLARYVKSITPPYKPHDYVTIAATLIVVLVVTILLTAFIRGSASEPGSHPQFFSNQLLVKIQLKSRYKVKDGSIDDTGIDSINTVGKQFKLRSFEKIAKPGRKSNTSHDLFSWYKLTLDIPETLATGRLDRALTVVQNKEANDSPGKLPESARNQAITALNEVILKLKKDPDVEAVDLNYLVTTSIIPNDPYYSSNGSWGQAYPDLWGIRKINPESAWDQTTGSQSVVVADVDTGVDRNHPDLTNNMWVNSNEIPGNVIDDDANGYVDDYYGWNWVSSNNNPMDDHGHGTHTVGTIGAVGNNSLGVVGVNWTTKIMALKFLDSGGSGSLANGMKALQYAADMGARVSSNSWGCACQSTAMDDAIAYEHSKGMVVVAAAGNSNGDALGFSPASADHAITVAASDSNDAKASFSNWGQKIDVAAPGVDILSLKASVSPMCTATNTVGTNYCRVSGTSMATPHVAGLVALILSRDPTLKNEEVRQILRGSAQDLGSVGKDANFGYGRINAGNSLNSVSHTLAPIITSPRSRTNASGTAFTINGSLPGPNFASYKIEAGAGRAPSTWTNLSSSTTQVSQNGTLVTVDTTRLSEGKYIFRLTATDTLGKTYQFQVHDVEVDNFDAVISFPLGLVSLANLDIIGTATTKSGLPFANFKLEWGQGTNPTSWSNSGITLVNNGQIPVVAGKLASWDTSGLADGQIYSLRLTVSSTLGPSYQAQVQTKADKDLLPGWPKMFANTICYCQITPVIADLNGDGVDEVIFGAPDGKIYVFRKDGSNFPGFPVSYTSSYYNWTVNVADLDSDGKKEIIGTPRSGVTYITRSDGTPYPGWSQPYANLYDNTPTIVDLDLDGSKDIVAIGVSTYVDRTDVKLHAYKLNGTELSGFPKSYSLPPVGFSAGQLYPTSYMGPLATADLDRDGKPEIAWGFSNRMYLFDNAGNIVPGWPFITPNYNNKVMLFYSAAATGDVYGDGNLELFAGAVGQGCLSCDTQLYGWKKDGTVLSGWPKTDLADGIKISWYNMATPSFADVDRDGKDEAMVGYQVLTIFDVEGKKALSGSLSMTTQPALSDVDGDGNVDFTGGNGSNLLVAKQDGIKYTKLWERSTTGGGVFYTPSAVADMDNNGKMEIAAITRGYAAIDGSLPIVAYLWELPNSSQTLSDWPMFSFDPARSGRQVFGSTGPTPTPPGPSPTTTQNATPTPTTSVPTPTPTTPLAPTPTPTQVPGDSTPPNVTITKPENNSTAPNKGQLQISSDASDTSGIASIEISFDGSSLDVCNNRSSCNVKIAVSGISTGTHTIKATAIDKSAGKNINSTSISVEKK